jgi:hypothetical protein
MLSKSGILQMDETGLIGVEVALSAFTTGTWFIEN